MEIKEFAKLIKKRLWLIILCVLVSTLTSAYYSYKNYQPTYVASNKLIINKTIVQDQDQVGIDQQMDLGAIAVNIGLIDTYKEIIKTAAIMAKVVQRYPELNLNANHLISTVNVSALNKTQVMTISTVDYSYERAANIVNAVAKVAETEIPRIMKVNNIEILNIADPNVQPAPENSNINQSIIISFIASLILAMGITFLLEFLNDTLKTKKDIQTVMGLPMLSAVPIIKLKKVKRMKKDKLRKQVGEAQYATIKQ